MDPLFFDALRTAFPDHPTTELHALVHRARTGCSYGKQRDARLDRVWIQWLKTYR